MRYCLLLLALLFSITARAVTIEQSCHNSVGGPATSISCTLTNAEPSRAYLFTAHWTNPTLASQGPFSIVKPACMTQVGSPHQTVNTGHDDWYYTMYYMHGVACCSGSVQFSIPDFGHYDLVNPPFDWVSVPVTNIQMTVTQIDGLDTSGGQFTGFCFGTGGSPSCSLAGIAAGKFFATWVSTSRGPMDTFTAGAGWTLDFASAPDTIEWQITDGTDPLPITFTGATTAYWNIMGAAVTTGANGPNVCGAVAPIVHRRVEF
jgi:hypothetical protein